MAYLKLGKTNINYSSKEQNSLGIIVSEVIESSSHPDFPKLISSPEDLDIYFGESFWQRRYYRELLRSGASLLLFSPVKNESEKPIDLSEYEEYIGEPLEEFPGPDDEQFVGKKIIFTWQEEKYTWYEGDYVNIKDLPSQNSPQENRDTLRLTTLPELKWCNPRYSGEYPKELKEELPGLKQSILESVDSHGEENDRYHLGYTLDFSGVREFGEKDFIVFRDANNHNTQFYFGKTAPLGADIIAGEKGQKVISVEDLISILRRTDKDHNYGYKVHKISDQVYQIYTSRLLPDQRFYNLGGLVFEPSKELTQDIYSILSEDHKRAEFYSKVIGPGDEPIKLKIEKVSGQNPEYYRVTISRYSYQEVFEGPLYLEQDPDTLEFTSLEKIINQGSKLVESKIYNEGRFKTSPEDGLPVGEYTLWRATKEEYTPEDYWRALEELKETEISEDFFLIPDMDKYIIQGASSDQTYLKEYEDLLEYCNSKNCQTLIVNYLDKIDGCSSLEILENPPENPEEGIMYGIQEGDQIIYQTWTPKGWKVYNSDPDHKYRVYEIQETFRQDYPGNYIFNYTKDQDNRLIYFWESMLWRGYYRPGYYMFLKGIISGNYQEETNDIQYISPVGPYEEDSSDLERYKSNFLSYNNHIFYYTKFFSHQGDWEYKTTILTRFCMDKVTNTVSREFPRYLSSETSGEILSGIRGILQGLKDSYPIIYSLDLDYIEEDKQKQSMAVYLTLGIRETLEKNVNLSLTLNFNYN